MMYNISPPYINFDQEYFLKNIYEIYSFQDAVKFVSNKINEPLQTRLRIIECAWNIQYESTDPISEKLVNFYSEMIDKLWLPEFYSKNNIKLSRKNYNDIKQKYLNKDEIYSFLIKLANKKLSERKTKEFKSTSKNELENFIKINMKKFY